MQDDSTPIGPIPLCACGCGKPVKMWEKTDRCKGRFQGVYRTFLWGHYRKYATAEEADEARRRYQIEYQRNRRIKQGQESITPVRIRRPIHFSSHKEWVAFRQGERRDLLNKIRLTTPCKRCGKLGTDPKKIHFHHRDPMTKMVNVSGMKLRAIELIEAEIAKCDILCVDCHRAVHREQGSPRRNRVDSNT